MKGPFAASMLFLLAVALPAQQPKVNNTQFRVETMGQNLATTVERVRHSSDQLWLGYDIAALPGQHISVCSDWSNSSDTDDECCGEYRLEDEFSTHHTSNAQGSQNLYLLYRFEKGDLVKVRLVGAGCHLNAGGVSFAWLPEVKPEESIAFLADVVNQLAESHKVAEGALLAISLHAAPDATRALEHIASSAASEHVREQAAFWLGVQRGHEGYLALKSLEDKSTDTHFREKLAFDFSQNSDPAAQDELLHMAKFDSDSKVRGQALFFGKARCAECHPAPYYTDNLMHNLKVERFFKEVTINGRKASADGPIKTFPLRGIKDSPPYLHDDRLLTLDDTVEFFNLVLELKLSGQEKKDLLAFLWVL